jgi:hypothetical protein
MVLASTVDRLIYGNDETFSVEDAIALERLLSRNAKASFLSRFIDIGAKGSISGRSSQGYAPGVGNVSRKDDPKTFAYDSRGRGVVRAGQWKLCRVGRDIEIEQVMDTDETKSVRLCYRDGQPTSMLLMVYVRVWFFQFGAYRMWKRPA